MSTHAYWLSARNATALLVVTMSSNRLGNPRWSNRSFFRCSSSWAYLLNLVKNFGKKSIIPKISCGYSTWTFLWFKTTLWIFVSSAIMQTSCKTWFKLNKWKTFHFSVLIILRREPTYILLSWEKVEVYVLTCLSVCLSVCLSMFMIRSSTGSCGLGGLTSNDGKRCSP